MSEKTTVESDPTGKMDFSEMLESVIPQTNWKLAFEGDDKRIFSQDKTGFFTELKKDEAKMKVRSMFKLATPSTVNALTQALCEDVERMFDIELFRQSRERIIGFKDSVFDLQTGKVRKYSTTDFILNP